MDRTIPLYMIFIDIKEAAKMELQVQTSFSRIEIIILCRKTRI